MNSTLDDAMAAVQKSDWSSVLQTLQQLPTQGKDRILWNLEAEDWEKVQKICLQALKNGDFTVKWEISKFYPKLGERAIAALEELLTSETIDDQCRWFMVRLLSQFDHIESILILVHLLYKTEDEELLSIASQSLANIGESAIDALAELMNEPEYRFLAVKALAQIRHHHTIPYLLRVVHDDSPEIRTMAIEALGSFRDPDILEILLLGLTDSASSVRKEVVIALALAIESYPQLSKQQMAETLKPLLYDVNLEVSQQTLFALGRMGNNEAAAAIFPLLKSPATPSTLKLDTVRALSWIHTAQALCYLQEGLRWSDKEVCQEIVKVLGRIEIPALQVKASEILIDFYYSQQKVLTNSQLKQAIALSLGELGQPTAIDCLRQLTQDSNKSVQLHALAALKKFSVSYGCE